MSTGSLRTHIVVPEELVREVDALVGPRHRSEFCVEAVRERVGRMKLRRLAHELAGSLKNVDTPDWETPEAASAWVRRLRRENDEWAFAGGDEA
jgi:metal-responsive CopG/Arc/MetJ family transcriptional regulator